jgi:hypothetical protein
MRQQPLRGLPHGVEEAPPTHCGAGVRLMEASRECRGRQEGARAAPALVVGEEKRAGTAGKGGRLEVEEEFVAGWGRGS